jgi:patatin-like phospholipase/acyl hydrolase
MNKKFKILSIDGGGLRGLIPLLILKYVEEKTGKKIWELFDLIVGTSTGGIVAAGLTATDDKKETLLTIEQIIDLYTKNADVIFPKKSGIGKIFNGVKSIFVPKYSPVGLDNLLKKYFKETKLSDTLKPICVTSYDLMNNEVSIFKSRKSQEISQNPYLYEICRATSAAPTYFPSYSMIWNNKKRTMIDGGVYVNNPTLVGISDALKNRYGRKVKLKDLKVLSLGTGTHSSNLGVKNTPNWGIIEWAKPITDVMMQSSSRAVDYQVNLLVDDYLRLQIEIGDEKFSSMSDSSPKTRDYLIKQVEEQIFNNSEIMSKIDKFIEEL